jgi:Dockerin type I domain
MSPMSAFSIFATLLAGPALAAAAGLNGDLNGDGRVDRADVDRMRAVFFSHDTQADLNGDGRVDFADLAMLKRAMSGDDTSTRAASVDAPPPPPAVYLQPETQDVTVGDLVPVDIYWDFTGDATLGGGMDVIWDPNAFSLFSVVFDANPDFDPAFTRLGDFSPGLIESLATGSFDGLAGAGPLYIATVTLRALEPGDFDVMTAETNGIAGPFVSVLGQTYPDLSFGGAMVHTNPGPPQPRIQVTPTSVTFPDTFIGQASSMQVHADSVGELPLTIAGLVPPGAPFSVSSDGCSGQTLQPGEGCDLSVDFTPTVEGAAADTVFVESDDPDNSSASVSLNGTGVVAPAPGLAVQSIVGVGAARVGQSKQIVVPVTSNGTAALVVGDVGVQNPLAPPFSIALDQCSAAVLQPGAQCLITVQFVPTARGPALDDFDIPSNDADSPATVRVYGVAAPRIALQGAGLSGQLGRCTNTTTSQVVSIPLSGGANLPCEGIGLNAASGEGLQLYLRGVAQSAVSLSGRVFGTDVGAARCSNVTTGQTVTLPVPSPQFDCVAAGLTVTPGDAVALIVIGSAI